MAGNTKTALSKGGRPADAAESKKDKRGGARAGAGRKKNSGAFGEGTTPMRIPDSMLPQIEAELEKLKNQAGKMKEQKERLAPAAETAKASLPQAPASAAQEALGGWGKPIDLGSALVKKPATSYILKIESNDWEALGVRSGDYVVIDRARKPVDGSLAAVMIDGVMSLRSLSIGPRGAWFKPEGEAQATEPTEVKALGIWGVASAVGREL